MVEIGINRKFPFIHFNGSKQQPEETFPDALNEIDEFATFIKKQKCPSCKKEDSFHLNTFERGQNGWECTVWCDCGVNGVFNNTGFHVKRLTVPSGTARTKK